MAYRYGDARQDARQFLAYAGIAPTSETVSAVAAWLTLENGVNNNPLGVTLPRRGVSVLERFPTKEAGLNAAASLFTGAGRYQTAEDRLRAGDAEGFISAIARSGWNAPGNYNIKGTDPKTVSWYPIFQKLRGDAPDENTVRQPSSNIIGQVATDIPAAAGDAIGGVFEGVAAVLLFLGIVLVGVVFLGGSFYLAKK